MGDIIFKGVERFRTEALKALNAMRQELADKLNDEQLDAEIKRRKGQISLLQSECSFLSRERSKRNRARRNK